MATGKGSLQAAETRRTKLGEVARQAPVLSESRDTAASSVTIPGWNILRLSADKYTRSALDKMSMETGLSLFEISQHGLSREQDLETPLAGAATRAFPME